jgi:hypothetical protein
MTSNILSFISFLMEPNKQDFLSHLYSFCIHHLDGPPGKLALTILRAFGLIVSIYWMKFMICGSILWFFLPMINSYIIKLAYATNKGFADWDFSPKLMK